MQTLHCFNRKEKKKVENTEYIVFNNKVYFSTPPGFHLLTQEKNTLRRHGNISEDYEYYKDYEDGNLSRNEVVSYLKPEKIMELTHGASKNTRSNLGTIVANYKKLKDAEQFKKQNIVQKTREIAQAR